MVRDDPQTHIVKWQIHLMYNNFARMFTERLNKSVDFNSFSPYFFIYTHLHYFIIEVCSNAAYYDDHVKTRSELQETL